MASVTPMLLVIFTVTASLLAAGVAGLNPLVSAVHAYSQGASPPLR